MVGVGTVIFTAIAICLVVAFALFWSTFKLRRLRRDLDDEGIQVIQLANQLRDQKKELSKLQSSIDTIFDWIEKTNVKSPAVDVLTTSGKSEDTEEESEESADDDKDNDVDKVPTNVRFRDSGVDTNSAEEVLLSSEPPPRKEKKDKEVKLRQEFSRLQEFAASFGEKLTKIGFFLPAEELLPVGTKVDLDFRLADGAPLICGKGEVKRVHVGNGESRHPSRGMDIRFIYLDQSSKEIIRRLTTTTV